MSFLAGVALASSKTRSLPECSRADHLRCNKEGRAKLPQRPSAPSHEGPRSARTMACGRAAHSKAPPHKQGPSPRARPLPTDR